MPAHSVAVLSAPEPQPAPAKEQPKISQRGKWVTNDAAEFINSLCPTHQYEFPRFDWCDSHENNLLGKACTTAFYMIRAAWDVYALDRLDPKQFTVSENRILTVIALKTLRFGKLVEKIPRRTFIKGDAGEDKYGFEIVPASGLANGNLTRGMASLRQKRAVGCVKADQHNGNDASNVYCIRPISEMLDHFAMYVADALTGTAGQGRPSATRCSELAELFKHELNNRCADIIAEDEGDTHGHAH